jgi:anti-sigma factor RsiW
MNCERFEPMLLAYMDGRAGDAERLEVDRHLLTCGECRARVAEFGRLWSLLEEAPAPEVSPAFDARLGARIAAEPRQAWWAWLPAPRMAFAAALLLVLSVWIGTRPPSPGDATLPVSIVGMEDERAVKDLQSLEDLDVLVNFEALNELPATKISKM